MRRRPTWLDEASELIREIVATAELVDSACTSYGEPIVDDRAIWRLLVTLVRIRARGCPCISDVARALLITRQSAHELTRKAAAMGLVELLTNPDDRRIVQVEPTARGKAVLAAGRSRERQWLNVLLNGLDDRKLRQVLQVMRVIRQRLVRDEMERRALSRSTGRRT